MYKFANLDKIERVDPILNPFAPGAGTPPPELAGRDELREQARIALARTRLGLPTKSMLLVGLRGVGKTVLLERMRLEAEAQGAVTVRGEALEERSLPSLLAPMLRGALLRLSQVERARELAHRALRGLAGFAKALKVKYKDIEVGIDFEAEPGLADNGDLELDLQALLEAAGEAAKQAGIALVLFVDEMQYVKEDELAALVTALHRCSQRQLPVVLVGAGLPQLPGRMGRAKSYAERLFDFPVVGPLTAEQARRALEVPLAKQEVAIDEAAFAKIQRETAGYPYFLQEWGKHSWEAAQSSPITLVDVQRATVCAVAALDESFFRVRFDRLSPAERRYLRAMAQLGPGPHRSGEVARELGRAVTQLAPMRNNLIGKGMIWSPNHGDTAFTVPLFDQFMRRRMPSHAWRSEA